LLLLVCLLGFSQAHLWLLEPISRGGVNSIGGTTGPCAGLQPNSGTRSTYNPGQQMTFQFRANQHGPGTFNLLFILNGPDSNFATNSTALASNLVYSVTATSGSFNGFTLNVNLPTTPCTQCAVQLSGMAQADGTSPWYQCADIAIRSAPLDCAVPTGMGYCGTFISYPATVASVTSADSKAVSEFNSAKNNAYSSLTATCSRQLSTLACADNYRRCDPDNNNREMRLCRSVCDTFKKNCGNYPLANVPALDCNSNLYSNNPNDTTCYDIFANGALGGSASTLHSSLSLVVLVLAILFVLF